MFTGIIQDIGTIAAIDKKGDWTLTITAPKLPLEKMALGASVACGGICLTVTEKGAGQFKVQVSMETLSKTTAIRWKTGQRINLEPALRAGDELGGHILSGHVDGVARVIARRGDGDSVRFIFEVPAPFARFLAPKGSAAIDGVSLTVNEVDGARFGVNIIPHTQAMTTLATLEAGDEANFEADMIARYVARMMEARA
jgi:riboflavin synthase